MENIKQKDNIMEQFEEKAKRPFGIRDKAGYAFGDLANNLTFVLVAMFMMKFYTDIMGVSAALVGDSGAKFLYGERKIFSMDKAFCRSRISFVFSYFCAVFCGQADGV